MQSILLGFKRGTLPTRADVFEIRLDTLIAFPETTMEVERRPGGPGHSFYGREGTCSAPNYPNSASV